DDGSSDETPAILAEYSAKLPCLRIIRREDRGFRKLGGGVIDAFYHGYDTINPDDFDYVCKLDLDLDLPPRYFQPLMERMEDNPLVNFEHLRPMGTSHKNWWTGRVRHGVGQYYMGTAPAYMFASAVFRMTRPPIGVGGLAMLWGYFRSMLQRKQRYGDAQFRR